MKIPGCIPSSLAQDIEDALLLAPDPKQVDDGCTYWRTFIQSFTRDNLVALARTIFFDLFKMADNDYVKGPRVHSAGEEAVHNGEDGALDLSQRAGC